LINFIINSFNDLQIINKLIIEKKKKIKKKKKKKNIYIYIYKYILKLIIQINSVMSIYPLLLNQKKYLLGDSVSKILYV